jgi:ComF family protein
MILLDKLLGVVAPHECLACGREGSLLCQWCQVEHILPFENGAALPYLDHLWIRTDYGGVAKQLLHRFKFERARAAATTIADALHEVLPLLPRPTLVIPVPTATSRVRERGYDHAALLAKCIAARQHLTYTRAVTRLTQTRQVGATREQRITQLAGAFHVVRPQLMRNTEVLLVDDVLTTGATLTETAKVLRDAGTATVSALVFARKQSL